MPNVRIKDQTTDTALTTGDYVIVDSETEGTRKYDLGALAARVEALEQGGGGTGLTQEEKDLILELFAKAAYADDDAALSYSELETLWTIITRSVSLNLSHVTSSNQSASVEGGSRYTTTLTADTNYTLNSVSVTMGGVDITSTSYSSGTVSIPSVNGNIVITATAVLAAQSITAVYTQSGTVYDTATLDSLKADLVVTANYSGGTSETVPASNYTLSGTLTVGTSTVTVNYAGLTTTFTVTVTAEPIDTSPVITDYDKYLNNSGTPTSGTGCCCTDFYNMLGTSLVIFTPWTEDSYPRSSLNVVSFSGTTKTHYWNGMSTQSAPKSVSLSAAASDSNKLRFSLFTSGLSSCYAYDSDSGDIYFAGEDSPYYGMSNISEAT